MLVTPSHVLALDDNHVRQHDDPGHDQHGYNRQHVECREEERLARCPMSRPRHNERRLVERTPIPRSKDYADRRLSMPSRVVDCRPVGCCVPDLLDRHHKTRWRLLLVILLMVVLLLVGVLRVSLSTRHAPPGPVGRLVPVPELSLPCVRMLLLLSRVISNLHVHSRTVDVPPLRLALV